MAIDINSWLEKLPGVEHRTVVGWIHEIATKGYTTVQMEQYVMDKYFIQITQDDKKKTLAINQFKKKWNMDPITGEELPQLESDPQESEPEDTPVSLDQAEEDSPEFEEDFQPTFPEQEDVPPPRSGYDDENPEDDDDDDGEDLDDDLRPELLDVPDAEEPDESDDLPYDNPDLGELDIGEDEREAVDPSQIMAQMRRHMPRRPAIRAERRDEMVTQSLTLSQYNEAMRPYKPFFDMFKEEGDLLVRYAKSVDMNNHPPYIHMRPYILNNAIKDINNTKVLMNIEDPAHPGFTTPQYVLLGKAVDVARNVMEKRFIQAALDNLTVISEHFEKDRQRLVALIYLLEIYCESNQRGKPMFEMTIPKQALIDTVTKAIDGLKFIIQDQLLQSVQDMRMDLKGEMVDVAKVVEKNMGKFDTQIAGAIDRVIWKVKTDVEETNLEDIKRAILYMLNKRTAAYHLGAGPLSVIALMVDDLDRRLVSENFKMDRIKEYRRYNISELQKKLGYKVPHTVVSAIKTLHKNKLVIVYKDSTFSLSK